MKLFLLSLILLTFSISTSLGANTLTSTVNTPGIGNQSKLTKLQIPFVENRGQVNPDVAFYARTFGGTLFITRSGQQIIQLPVAKPNTTLSIYEKFIGATITTPVGLEPTTTKIHIFKGKDPKSWRENVPNWNKIGINNVYPGIDYQLRPLSQYAEKIFIVKPEADPAKIRLSIEGVDNLSINTDGSLKLHSPAGDLEYSPPIAYQQIDEKRIPVKVSYMVNGKTYGFKVGKYNQNLPLIIDPLIRTSFFGGTNQDYGYGIAVNQTTGSVYITGYTSSADLPTTAGVFKETKSEADFQDIYVAKFDSELTTLEAATYYGSNGWEYGAAAIALHPDGSVYLAGKTQGTDLPGAATGYQTAHAGGGDAFVARLNEDLTGPPQATYLGGTGEETGISIAVNSYPSHDLYGSVYIAGRTNSTDFPGTTGGFLETNQGSTDVFVAYFDAALGTLGQATYFGGTGWEEPATDARGQALLVHPGNGDVMLVGWTSSNTITSLMYGRNGTSDAFYARLFSTLDDAQTGTYIGGNDQDMASAMAIMPLEGSTDVDVFVVGRTKSTTDLVDPAHEGFYTAYQGGNFDAFVVGLHNVVKTYSTYLGGESDDRGYGIIVNPVDKRVWVTGETLSTDFPAAVDQADNAGYIDAFVSALSLDLSSLDYSSYLGGTNGDYGTAMAIHEPSRRLYVVGSTSSSDLHGTGVQSYDSSYNESGDAFVALFDELNINPPPSLWVTQDIGPGRDPDLGVDDEGNLYACYFQGDQMHIKKRSPAGIWTITGSYDRPDGTGFLDCSIAVQANGGVHVCLVTTPPHADMSGNAAAGNHLWYRAPGADLLEAVDINEQSANGVDSECSIALEQNRPSISYRVIMHNQGWWYSLAVAIKPAPDQDWIVMNNLQTYENDDTYWMDDSDYGKATALAFDSSGLPLVAFTDEDGTVSFFIPSFYPPLIATTLPEWTRYTSALTSNSINLQFDHFAEDHELFRLHCDTNEATRDNRLYLFKSDSIVTDVLLAETFDVPEFSSNDVSDSASVYDMITSHNSQARFIRIESEFDKKISVYPDFAPTLGSVFPHYTEVVGNDLNHCALSLDASITAHALCENSTGNLVYARRASSASGFLGVSPLSWKFGQIQWSYYTTADIADWRAFYLTNHGSNLLFIRDIYIESPDPAPWTMELDCDLDFPIDLSSDVALAPGQTAAVCVRPDPAAYADDQISAQLVVETYQQNIVSELSAGSPASDDDNDGVPDEEEMGPDGTDASYDGNSDGIADSLQNNVASLHTHDDAHYVTLAAESGLTLEDVTATSNPTSEALPEDLDSPYGFFYFVVDGLASGASTTVTLILPVGETPESYWKFGPTPSNATSTWYEFDYDSSTGAQISSNVITLYLTDGARGDHDLIADGRIVDPGVPTVTATATTDGDGGGGCFIATAAYGSYLDPHVLTLRKFRDQHLLTNSIGTWFVEFYYRYSPPLADYIRERETLRALVRSGLAVVIYSIEYPTVAGLILLLPALILIRQRRRRVNTISNC